MALASVSYVIETANGLDTGSAVSCETDLVAGLSYLPSGSARAFREVLALIQRRDVVGSFLPVDVLVLLDRLGLLASVSAAYSHGSCSRCGGLVAFSLRVLRA